MDGLTAHRLADLLGHVLDLAQGVRQEAVGLQEVKGAEGEQLKGDADVTVEVEPVQHLHAVADGKEKERKNSKAKKKKSRRKISQGVIYKKKK